MFVGCSEISVKVTVKHVQHIGIIRCFCLLRRNLLSFSVPGGPKKLAGLWFTRGITTQVDTMKDYLEVQKNLQGCVLLGRGQYPGRHYEGLSGGPKKLAGLRFTRGISTQVDTEGLSPEKAV